jgi:hypothetical protein
MTTAYDTVRTETDKARPVALVWIDAREAVIVRMQGARTRLERVESDVPPHRRATGHVRHDPAVRHGGGGSPQTAGEPHRIEHLNRYVAEIANRLEPGDGLLILGPGTVHERLAQRLAESDARHGTIRDIVCEASPSMTDRQLIARLRRFAGVEPRRCTVGAYRWSEPLAHRPSGRAIPSPRRVANKPPRDRGQEVAGEWGEGQGQIDESPRRG